MWIYEKRLEYPVKIKNPNPALAKVIVSQLGGPDGELGAATRYLQQRYSMANDKVIGILTDIGVSVSKLRINHKENKEGRKTSLLYSSAKSGGSSLSRFSS